MIYYTYTRVQYRLSLGGKGWEETGVKVQGLAPGIDRVNGLTVAALHC